MALCCEEHEDSDADDADGADGGGDDEAHLLYCEQCLIGYLAQNDERCPLSQHAQCTFGPAHYWRRQIKNATVRCPHGMMAIVPIMNEQEGRGEFGQRDVEGTHGVETKQKEEQKKKCLWKGKLKVKNERQTVYDLYCLMSCSLCVCVFE